MFRSLKWRQQIIARFTIAIVIFLNLQSAILFSVNPSSYAPAFELFGTAGEIAIRGFGVLFFMWTIPYLVAFSNPAIHRVSYLQAVLMQTIGLLGESIILITIPVNHPLLSSSILRFITFDGAGLILLIIGYFSIHKNNFGNVVA